MNTKYYAWKDGKQSDGKQEWVELTPNEFIELCNKNVRRKRTERRYFYQLPGLEEGDYYLYLECTYEQFLVSRAEKQMRTRRRKEKEKMIDKGQRYSVVPLDAPIEDESDDTCSFHDLIPNPDSFFEDNLILSMDIQNALKTLTEDEHEIIEILYLSEYAVSERSLARTMGIPQKTLNNRKKIILNKLKKNLAHS